MNKKVVKRGSCVFKRRVFVQREGSERLLTTTTPTYILYVLTHHAFTHTHTQRHTQRLRPGQTLQTRAVIMKEIRKR